MTNEDPGELWVSQRWSHVGPFYLQGPIKHKPVGLEFRTPTLPRLISLRATSFLFFLLLASFVRSLNSFSPSDLAFFLPHGPFSNRLRHVYCSGLKYIISLSQSPKLRCTLFSGKLGNTRTPIFLEITWH